ncbi:uroporphyrinogen-III synthase [Orrella daihaiensis]|uniref:Uroporphyrinogen-III synthase n=1 Tax=Orrella daihaiensis TaxID=2782176 RepID=A0ABY4AHH0_9BURK|nr:uroporphyrinogen-III synthase [Orrella daihaiensis]UOD49739.1 uroporphyrinogen-III synthase [Orrella daihaiensis]
MAADPTKRAAPGNKKTSTMSASGGSRESAALNQHVKRVVLTRPTERQKSLVKNLRQQGCEVLELPALTISPRHPQHLPSSATSTPNHVSPTRGAVQEDIQNWRPEQFDALIFVSRSAWQNYCRFYLSGQFEGNSSKNPSPVINAVETQQPSWIKRVASLISARQLIVACVGVATAKQIADDLNLPLSTIVYPSEGLSADSEGLWTLLKPILGPGKKVLIVRGQTGRDWLLETLTEHGISVSCLSVYQREPACWDEDQIQVLTRWASGWNRESTHRFTSPEDTDVVSNAGIWLITSAQGLAAIRSQYQLHGFLGKPGFKPERVVVIHDRLVSPVRQWLAHWEPPQRGPTDHALIVDQTPIVVVAPDDESIISGILVA